MTNTATISNLVPRPVNALVGMNVRIIMQLRDKSQADLAKLIHTTQSSMSRRIKGITDWAPDELVSVATYLEVPVGRFFTKLPDLDSNQEPAGFKYDLQSRVSFMSDHRVTRKPRVNGAIATVTPLTRSSAS